MEARAAIGSTAVLLSLIASLFVEEKVRSTKDDGTKSEKTIEWPASKKRDLTLLGNSLTDCPATLTVHRTTGDHKFNVKLVSYRRFLSPEALCQSVMLAGHRI